MSGVGDDANPCSRKVPCKTFAGSISKTATGGEINCLDPGGFGGLTITEAITISCEVGTGGVRVGGTNGFTVNAASTDVVVLEGLDFRRARHRNYRSLDSLCGVGPCDEFGYSQLPGRRFWNRADAEQHHNPAFRE